VIGRNVSLLDDITKTTRNIKASQEKKGKKGIVAVEPQPRKWL
jgi:hypothetical protein